MDSRPDIIVRGGTVLNVYSGEMLRQDVVISGEKIRYVGSVSGVGGSGADVLDIQGKILVPGYIDPHFHPWNIYNPVSFGKAACRLGTTTLVCDNLIFYMLMGLERFESFIDLLSEMPIKYFWFCRAVPQTPMENEKTLFSFENLKRLLGNRCVLSLGEITRWRNVVEGDRDIINKIRETRRVGKRVDGHTAGAGYDNLNALSGAGVESCHESITGEEAMERLRLGMYVMLRQSSLRQDLAGLLKPITEGGLPTDRLMLTTDSSTPAYYQEHGINEHLIEIAIQEGIDPISAYRMSTINPAVYFGLDCEIGGIAPGRYADMLVLEDLLCPAPEMVISKGCMVAKKDRLIRSFPEPDWGRYFPATLSEDRGWHAERHIFEIPCDKQGMRLPAITLINPVITKTEWVEVPAAGGVINISLTPGLCFVALMDREGRWITNSLLKGFGESVQGLASSFNTATQILAIGKSPEAMSRAVNRVREIGGGITAVENGRIAYELPLPLGGMMSDRPMEEIAEKQREFQRFLRRRGYSFHDPLYTLIFLPNDFLPQVRINYKGVVDITKNKILWPRRDLKC